jgi:hypothetical protein
VIVLVMLDVPVPSSPVLLVVVLEIPLPVAPIPRVAVLDMLVAVTPVSRVAVLDVRVSLAMDLLLRVLVELLPLARLAEVLVPLSSSEEDEPSSPPRPNSPRRLPIGSSPPPSRLSARESRAPSAKSRAFTNATALFAGLPYYESQSSGSVFC